MRICRAMHWRYEWVGSLPQDVYEVLVDMLNREAEQQERGEP